MSCFFIVKWGEVWLICYYCFYVDSIVCLFVIDWKFNLFYLCYFFVNVFRFLVSFVSILKSWNLKILEVNFVVFLLDVIFIFKFDKVGVFDDY